MSKRVSNKRGGPGIGARSRRTWATHRRRTAFTRGSRTPVTPRDNTIDRRVVQVKKPPLIFRAITVVKRFFRSR